MFAQIIEGLKSLIISSRATTLEERRRMARIQCNFPVRLSMGHHHVPARVTNLGVEGMRLRAKHGFPKGSPVTVVYQHQSSYEELSSVHGMVAWNRRDPRTGERLMGIRYEYTQRNWVDFVLGLLGLNDDTVFQRRKFVRAEGMLPGKLSVPGRIPPQRCWVLNLGLGGALVDSPTMVGPGRTLKLELGPLKPLKPLPLMATVREAREADSGQSFHLGVEFTDLDAARTRSLGRFVIVALKESIR
jgi:hypothetical protein